MNEKSRLFDFLQNQLDHFPKTDMIAGKENGQWKLYSTAEVTSMVNNLSIALIRLGISGNDMTVENQDKVAIISKNRSKSQLLALENFYHQENSTSLYYIYPQSRTIDYNKIY